MGKHKVAGKSAMTRTLFLSDSILSSVSSQSLKTNSRDMCVKKMLYYLTDFSKYEPEFEYSDKVIISSGINDITRRYLSPEIVSDVVLPQITKYSRLYPNTKFVFNTTLLATSKLTNSYVISLNKYLAEGIKHLPNVFILDSHSILLKSILHSVYSDRNGIHITREVANLIKNELIHYLTYS